MESLGICRSNPNGGKGSAPETALQRQSSSYTLSAQPTLFDLGHGDRKTNSSLKSTSARPMTAFARPMTHATTNDGASKSQQNNIMSTRPRAPMLKKLLTSAVNRLLPHGTRAKPPTTVDILISTTKSSPLEETCLSDKCSCEGATVVARIGLFPTPQTKVNPESTIPEFRKNPPASLAATSGTIKSIAPRAPFRRPVTFALLQKTNKSSGTSPDERSLPSSPMGFLGRRIPQSPSCSILSSLDNISMADACEEGSNVGLSPRRPTSLPSLKSGAKKNIISSTGDAVPPSEAPMMPGQEVDFLRSSSSSLWETAENYDGFTSNRGPLPHYSPAAAASRGIEPERSFPSRSKSLNLDRF